MARILVVDHEPIMVRLFRVQLERAGHVVDTASNGLEALARLAEEPPVDLLITEVIMAITTPRMDGFLLMKKTREAPRYASLPFILTGYRFSSAEEACRQWLHGVDPSEATSYLLMPFHPASMVGMVQDMVTTHKRASFLVPSNERRFLNESVSPEV